MRIVDVVHKPTRLALVLECGHRVGLPREDLKGQPPAAGDHACCPWCEGPESSLKKHRRRLSAAALPCAKGFLPGFCQPACHHYSTCKAADKAETTEANR